MAESAKRQKVSVAGEEASPKAAKSVSWDANKSGTEHALALSASATTSSVTLGLTTVEVENADVQRLILQYLKEQGLVSAMRALQRESGVALNAVESRDTLAADVRAGRWDAVLPTVAALELPAGVSRALYEQVVIELLEAREVELARAMLRTAAPLEALKRSEPERYLRLEHLSNRCASALAAALAGGGHMGGAAGAAAGAAAAFESILRDAYPAGDSKERRRLAIADALAGALGSVAPSRLATLLGQSLRWQQHVGALPRAGGRVDLWRGGAKGVDGGGAAKGSGGLGGGVRDLIERHARRQAGAVRFGAQSHCEAAAFAPDGSALATGSVDGFFEVYDYETCKLRRDLPYQAADELMMHDAPVLAITFARDGEHAACGDQKGCIKVWHLATGKCTRRFERAHGEGVTCVAFARDGSQLLSGSFDTTVKAHGLRSGKALKEFRGHTSFVNAVAYFREGGDIFSASSDGSVRVWDARTTECTCTFRPAAAAAAAALATASSALAGGGAPPPAAASGSVAAGDFAIHTLVLVPPEAAGRLGAGGGGELLLVADRSGCCYLMSARGAVVRVFESTIAREKGGDFTAAALSPRGGFVYAVTECGELHCFEAASGRLEHTLRVADGKREVAGVAHHPHRNLLATWTAEGVLKLWRP
jgi:WD40 repeat-containing protein SMU1